MFVILALLAILKSPEIGRNNCLKQGRPIFFSRGPNLLFQKIGEPKFIDEDQKKKKGLRSDLISVFSQKAGEDQKKGLRKRILWYFSVIHNVSAEASINQPTQKPFVGHFKTFGGPLLARGPRLGRPWSQACY